MIFLARIILSIGIMKPSAFTDFDASILAMGGFICFRRWFCIVEHCRVLQTSKETDL